MRKRTEIMKHLSEFTDNKNIHMLVESLLDDIEIEFSKLAKIAEDVMENLY